MGYNFADKAGYCASDLVWAEYYTLDLGYNLVRSLFLDFDLNNFIYSVIVSPLIWIVLAITLAIVIVIIPVALWVIALVIETLVVTVSLLIVTWLVVIHVITIWIVTLAIVLLWRWWVLFSR